MNSPTPRVLARPLAAICAWILFAIGPLVIQANAQFPKSQLFGLKPQTGELFRSTTTEASLRFKSVGVTISEPIAMDFDEQGNLLWGAFKGFQSVVYGLLDTQTGAWSPRFSLPVSREVGDLACGRFSEGSSSPWFLSSPNAGGSTTTILGGDVRSGDMVPLFDVPGRVTRLALIRNSRLLAYRESSSELLQIDTVTGAFTAVRVDPRVSIISDLDYDTASGQLFGFMTDTQGAHWLGRLDPATGAVELLEDMTVHGPGLRIAIRRGERPLDAARLCAPAVTGSSGQPAQIDAIGSARIERGDLVLRASDLPSSTFGLFLASLTTRSPITPAASIGNLCLGGDVGRITDGGQPLSTQGFGFFEHALDLSAIAQPNGVAAVMATETWAFQTWFRDSSGGTPVSNFSDAIAVSFLGESDRSVFERPSLRFASLTHMATGDVTGDGHAELVGGGIGFLSGRGLFAFSAAPDNPSGVELIYSDVNLGQVVGLSLADLDHDGDLDVVVATRSSPLLRTLLNDGTGGLTTAYQEQVCIRPTLARAADLDGDGFMDVVLGCTSARLKVLFGRGDGTLTPALEITFGEDPSDVALVDLDSDGRSEIISLLSLGGEIEVRPVSAARVIGAPTRYGVGPGGVALSSLDQDLDGNVDVLALRTNFGAAALLRGTGTGTLSPSVDIPLGPSPASVDVTDLDHDGRDDLLVAEASNGSFQRWMNVGPLAYSLSGEEKLGHTITGIASADMDGDGLSEVILAGNSSDTTFLPGTTVASPH
ncbi:MAG: VCBS repeat-containing protein, partial [Planctomycetota bacterium]